MSEETLILIDEQLDQLFSGNLDIIFILTDYLTDHPESLQCYLDGGKHASLVNCALLKKLQQTGGGGNRQDIWYILFDYVLENNSHTKKLSKALIDHLKQHCGDHDVYEAIIPCYEEEGWESTYSGHFGLTAELAIGHYPVYYAVATSTLKSLGAEFIWEMLTDAIINDSLAYCHLLENLP